VGGSGEVGAEAEEVEEVEEAEEAEEVEEVEEVEEEDEEEDGECTGPTLAMKSSRTLSSLCELRVSSCTAPRDQ